MSRHRSTTPTWQRPMRGWWRDPYFGRYMLREASALFIGGYALVLLAGLACLWIGDDAYAGWRAALASPWSIALHGVAFGFALWHSWTWFQVMPKTAPPLPVGERAITAGGVAAAVVASVAVFALAAWGSR
jgi:fumarate reductase subunit C